MRASKEVALKTVDAYNKTRLSITMGNLLHRLQHNLKLTATTIALLNCARTIVKSIALIVLQACWISAPMFSNNLEQSYSKLDILYKDLISAVTIKFEIA